MRVLGRLWVLSRGGDGGALGSEGGQEAGEEIRALRRHREGDYVVRRIRRVVARMK